MDVAIRHRHARSKAFDVEDDKTDHHLAHWCIFHDIRSLGLNRIPQYVLPSVGIGGRPFIRIPSLARLHRPRISELLRMGRQVMDSFLYQRRILVGFSPHLCCAYCGICVGNILEKIKKPANERRVFSCIDTIRYLMQYGQI